MGNKEKEHLVYAPYSRAVIITTLSFVLATGGYGGYYVSKQAPLQGILSSEYETTLYEVERVLDGDTIELSNGSKVRLLGISAPEFDACHGPESKQVLQTLLLGQQVMLQKDSTASDELGRLLRYVFLYSSEPKTDNIFVNNYLVRQGHALSDNRSANRRYEQLLNNSMGLAKREALGLHSSCTVQDDYLQPTDESCIIKGNNNYGTSSDIYYEPDCFAYSRLQLRWSQGDQYFCTAQEAEAAGYRRAQNCPQ